jgi:hypothetical protein
LVGLFGYPWELFSSIPSDFVNPIRARIVRKNKEEENIVKIEI